MLQYPDETEFGHNVVPSKVGSTSQHMQEFNIEGLTVNMRYGAKVNCKNEFGETGWSEEFFFNTSEGKYNLHTVRCKSHLQVSSID